MAVDEKAKAIILAYLAKWKTTRVNKEKLLELKEEIIKRVGYKTLPLTTLKKWVRKVVKETKQAEKLKAIKYEAPSPIAAPISEKAFLQTIAFDIAAMRKSLERISSKLTEIEKRLGLK